MSTEKDLETSLLAIKASGDQWLKFKPSRVHAKLPGKTPAEKGAAASALLRASDVLRAHWPFLAAIAELPLDRDAVIALLETISPKKMVAGPNPELAPCWHGCLHELVARTFVDDPSPLAALTVSREIQPGLTITRALLGAALSDAERAQVRPKLGATATPVGQKPSAVLARDPESGELTMIPWKTARERVTGAA